MKQEKSTLKNFELTSGEFVYGRQIDDKVLHAREGQRLDTQVSLSTFNSETNITPFGEKTKTSRILNKTLPGMLFFSLDEPVMGVYTTYDKTLGGHIQIYTLFDVKNKILNAQGIRLMNFELDPFYMESFNEIPLSSNLARENYFFESRRFITGDKALEEFDRIKYNLGTKRSNFN